MSYLDRFLEENKVLKSGTKLIYLQEDIPPQKLFYTKNFTNSGYLMDGGQESQEHKFVGYTKYLFTKNKWTKTDIRGHRKRDVTRNGYKIKQKSREIELVPYSINLSLFKKIDNEAIANKLNKIK